MLELVKTNQLHATDLVWNESLPNWVPASEASELSSALCATPTIPSATLTGGVFKGIFEEAKANFKKGWDSSKATPNNVPTPDVLSATTGVGETVSMQAEQSARLPLGVQMEDIVVQCLVEYKGGHPNQTEADSGYLYLTRVGLYFVAVNPHSISQSRRSKFSIF